jgi:WD40-like Beta Propeller Repeat
MKFVLVPFTTILVLVVALSCSSDDSVSVSSTGTPISSATPTSTPKVAPWLGSDNAFAADQNQLLGADKAAWFAVDPQTGQPQKLANASGYIGSKLAGGRYALVQVPSEDPIQTHLGRLDIAAQAVTDIGPGWSGEISADGHWAAILPVVEGSALAVVDIDSKRRFDMGDLGKPVFLAWAPDDTLAIVHDEVLYVARGPDWQPQRMGDFAYAWPVWSTDSQWLTVAVQAGVRLISPDLQQQRDIPIAGGGGGGSVAWSPDGKRLAVGGGTGWYVVDLDTGAVTQVAPNSAVPQRLALPLWSPDGTQIAADVIESKGGPFGIAVAQADGSGAHMITTGILPDMLGWTHAGILVGLHTNP